MKLKFYWQKNRGINVIHYVAYDVSILNAPLSLFCVSSAFASVPVVPGVTISTILTNLLESQFLYF